MQRILGAIQRFFSTWRFAVFTIATMGALFMFLATLLAMPITDGAMGQFAEEFKIWCFGYDPATGQLEWSFVAVFLLQPLVLSAVVVGMWSDTLGEALRRPVQAVPSAAAGLLLIGVSAVAMGALQEPPVRGELPFPAESLRTEIPAPALNLVGSDGRAVDLSALRGRVVMITAVYASCGETCPMIFAQANQAIASLPEEHVEDLTVIAITLDPTRDTPEVMARMASARGLDPRRWSLASGDPAVVEATLDRLGFTRSRDPKSGMIDHANLFLLVDRDGRLAYRFTLGQRQKRWLTTALGLLLEERTGA